MDNVRSNLGADKMIKSVKTQNSIENEKYTLYIYRKYIKNYA